MKQEAIKRVVIVGGGTAGWIAATYLHKLLRGKAEIVVIEAPAIGRIGVGEATVPSIKEEVFDVLGIPESEWMPVCNGSFKLGIRYENWKRPREEGGDHFYHLFGELEDIDGLPLSHYWIRKKLLGQTDRPMASEAYVASHLCEAMRSPIDRGGERHADYAYHFDAIVVGDFLGKWAQERGVQHIAAEVTRAELDDRRWIAAVHTKDGQRITGDLFIDCTGFRGVLINQALEEPFVSYSDSLLCDRAVALNVPDDGELVPYTKATALKHGWVWQIPLQGRRGCGYVYSSAHVTPDEAERELVDLLGFEGNDEWPIRHIRMRVGRTQRAWVNNCVSIGLANSFIEPLESTGIYFSYAALYQLGKHFPTADMPRALRDSFNERIAYMVDDVRDFIVMHYCTSPRTDTPFWNTCNKELPIPDSLRQTLELWDAGVPIKTSYSGNLLYSQFEASYDRFWTNSNYAAVLVGNGRLPQRPAPRLAFADSAIEHAEKRFAEIARKGASLVGSMPSHKEYLELQRDSKLNGAAAVEGEQRRKGM